jgi:membrane protein DedA with SNARE-associated domain
MTSPGSSIKHFLTRYSAFLWALMKPLGIWGVFVVATLDGAAIGLPMDAVVGGYVYANPARIFLYALMGASGSAFGSILIYAIGYKGGEELLRKRIQPQKFEKFHRMFDKHPFRSLMIPAMLPPPTPFKLVQLTAAASEMSLAHFLLAVFIGRFLRFTILGLLVLKFGPDVVRLIASVVQKHLTVLLVIVAAGGLAWFLHWRANRSNDTSGAETSPGRV